MSRQARDNHQQHINQIENLKNVAVSFARRKIAPDGIRPRHGPRVCSALSARAPPRVRAMHTISNSNKKNGRAVSFLSVILRFAAFPVPSLCWQIQSLLSECKPHVFVFVSVFVSVLFLFLFSLLCSDSTPNTTLAAAGLLTGCSAGRSGPSRTCPSPTPSSRRWS